MTVEHAGAQVCGGGGGGATVVVHLFQPSGTATADAEAARVAMKNDFMLKCWRLLGC